MFVKKREKNQKHKWFITSKHIIYKFSWKMVCTTDMSKCVFVWKIMNLINKMYTNETVVSCALHFKFNKSLVLIFQFFLKFSVLLWKKVLFIDYVPKLFRSVEKKLEVRYIQWHCEWKYNRKRCLYWMRW
jgi:hypothetical protein